ncbi:MAG: hypothetical protein ACLGHP_09180, partial [Vicinamibacteria bacterium]
CQERKGSRERTNTKTTKITKVDQLRTADGAPLILPRSLDPQQVPALNPCGSPALMPFVVFVVFVFVDPFVSRQKPNVAPISILRGGAAEVAVP